MADLRLDDIEAAFEQTSGFDIGIAEPDKAVQNLNIPLDQLEMFNTQQEIKRKSYDEWYEKGLQFLQNTSDNPILDVSGEAAAGVLQYVPSLANTAALGVTDFVGASIEAVSSVESFKEAAGSVLANAVATMLYVDDPLVYEAYGGKPLAKGPDEKADPEQFIPSPDANIFEKTGKNIRALSFYGYANTKAFQQQLLQDADHPIVHQVAGAFGSISTSALLASVNPQLAMWAIGGHEGANFYLEQVSRGADWAPSLGYGALIGAGVARLEQMSINILYKRFATKLALMADTAVINGVEEFSQSVFVSGVEQAVGAEDRTAGEIFKQATFEAAIGAFGGGVAGASTMQFAYARMDKRLKKMGIKKKARQATIMRSMAEGTSILEMMEGMGATQADLDIARKVANGEMDANEGMLELNRRMNERLRESGIDTYRDSDPDALVEEQRRKDSLEESQADPDQTLTPEEQVEGGLTFEKPEEGDVNPRYTVFKNGEVVATAQVDQSRDKPFLTNIRVKHEHRRQGIATRLVEVIEEHIGQRLTPSPIKISKEMAQFHKKREAAESKETVSELDALLQVADFVASHDLGSQQIKDIDGNIVANVNPGMPRDLRVLSLLR